MQLFKIKRAIWPSFFVCLGLSFCTAVSASHDYLGLWLGLSCLLIAWVIGPAPEKKYSLPALTLISLIILILCNLLMVKHQAFPIAYFVVSYGLIGFIVFSVLKKNHIAEVFRIIVVLFCLLSVWSMAQYIFSYGKLYTHGLATGAIFANPNTYAATINIILLPLISIYLIKHNCKSTHLYFVIMVLFSGLITTQSRGGWVAFTIGVLWLIGMLLSTKKHLKFLLLKRLLYGFVLVFILVSGSKLFVLSLSLNNEYIENNHAELLIDDLELAGLYDQMSLVTQRKESSLAHRKDMVFIAWKNIKENIYFGIGYYNTIYYYFKDITRHVYSKTHYIHNDYLQFWLELGLLGIIFLLSIVSTTYLQGIRALKNMIEEDRVWAIAILSGLTTIFVHALVSFVFYVPLLVCLFSGYVAVLNTIMIKNNDVVAVNIGAFMSAAQIIDIKTSHKRMIISTIILIYLFGFVFAQISYRAGQSMLEEGNIEQASTLFRLARESSSSEVNNYLTEAAYWKNSAFKNNNHKAADRADELYEKVMSQNKYDADSRLQRAVLHRDGYILLSKPASKESIINWFEQALKWRPHHNILQSEYLRTLKRYGRVDEARILITKYLKKYPDSKSLAKVREEIMN
jgi:O-antigen ligase